MNHIDPIAELARAREELLRERFEERAAILEFDAGFTRAGAERIARAMYATPEDKQAELYPKKAGR
jgi:hypothetical protein